MVSACILKFKEQKIVTDKNKENDNHFEENQSNNSLQGNKKNIFIKIFDWCKRSFLHPTIITIFLILVAFFLLFVFNIKNNLQINVQKIDNLLFKEANRAIIQYSDNVKMQNFGLFFIGKKSEFYNFKNKSSVHIDCLDNINAVYVGKEHKSDNRLIIINKLPSNYLELIKYDIKTQKLLKTELNIQISKDAILGKPFDDFQELLDGNFHSINIPVYEKGNNYIISINKDKVLKIPYNLNIILGKIIDAKVITPLYVVGGYEQNSNKYSNSIYETNDCFKTLKKIANINTIQENSKAFLVFSNKKEVGDYPAQEIWIITDDKLTKYDIWTKKIKISKLPKEFKNSEFIKILSTIGIKGYFLGSRMFSEEIQIGFIKNNKKIYYFPVVFGRKIKIKFLTDKHSENTDFFVIHNLKNNKITIFVIE